MSEEILETPDTEVQEGETSVDTANDTLEEVDPQADDAYNNQKKRAEKAEAELKEVKARIAGLSVEPSGEKEKPQEELIETNSLSLDDVFVAKQLDTKEEYNQAIKVAKLEGISVADAIESDLYKAWKKTSDEKKKSEQASLGASKGSGAVKEKKGFDSPETSDEDHEAMFKARLK